MSGVRAATARLEDWMLRAGAPPLPFQRETWRAWRTGDSGLIHAPTGSGKTLAVWCAALVDAMARKPWVQSRKKSLARDDGPRLIWITPRRHFTPGPDQATIDIPASPSSVDTPPTSRL